MFDLAGGLAKSGTWRNHAPLAAAYRARLCLVRTIVKPLLRQAVLLTTLQLTFFKAQQL